jgi:hypothetical protein
MDKTVDELVKRINEDTPDSGPQFSLYYPNDATFPLYDCFLVFWNKEGKRISTSAYQLKEGKGLPHRHQSTSEGVDKSYVIRGDAAQRDYVTCGWIAPSTVTMNEFFGVSGKEWTPEKWKELEHVVEKKRKER